MEQFQELDPIQHEGRNFHTIDYDEPVQERRLTLEEQAEVAPVSKHKVKLNLAQVQPNWNTKHNKQLKKSILQNKLLNKKSPYQLNKEANRAQYLAKKRGATPLNLSYEDLIPGKKNYFKQNLPSLAQQEQKLFSRRENPFTLNPITGDYTAVQPQNL